jgi:putative ABC transport system permease protein
MRSIIQDLRFALRMLGKNPGFTVVAVLTLALGIGANSAIFSVVDAVLLRPLPYRDPHRLIYLSQVNLQTQTNGIFLSFPKYTQIAEQNRTMESVAAYFASTLNYVTKREPEALNGARATGNFFQVLGIAPVLGRTFLPEEELPGAADVAILSDGFWHNHFAGDEHVLGRSIVLDGKTATIIGVLPASFSFPLQFPEPDVWLPRVTDAPFLRPEQVRTGAGYLVVLGRLRDGETLARAQAEFDAINARYREQFGGYADANKYGISAVLLETNIAGGMRTGLMVLLAAVGFVLLIACVNVANLLLARATARERELAIRKALGASGLRLVRQLLSESALLSFGGGALGVCLAAAAIPLLRAFSPGSVPRLADTRVDGAVLAFSLFLCVLTGIVFGLMPALQAARGELHETLKEGTRGSTEGGRGKFRSALIVAEMAIALVLMTGAGLLIESFAHLMRVNPGFTAQNLMTFQFNLPPDHYGQGPQMTEFYRELIGRVKIIPEVQAAGVTSYLPLTGAIRFVYFCPEGRACEGIGKDPLIAIRQVSPEYFDTVRTPLLHGRVFSEKDTATGQPVVIVNQTVASRYWPGQDPIGKHLANSRDMLQREVVGVVGDVKFNALNVANSEEMYVPLSQLPWQATALIVRSQAAPQPLVAAVRAKIAEIDPNLPVTGISSMEDVLSASVAQPRIIMEFAGVFAGFALLLSAIGIYGVMAYTVSARKQEMGIRMSMGAESRDILKLVVGQGMRLTLLGAAIGVVASLALTRLLASLLFGIRTADPWVFTGATLVLVISALLACYLPALRATRVDPIIVLRYE